MTRLSLQRPEKEVRGPKQKGKRVQKSKKKRGACPDSDPGVLSGKGTKS